MLMGLFFLIVAIEVIIDLVTKQLAVIFLSKIDTLPLWEGVLHLTYEENRGAAFGMLKDDRWVFLIASTAFIIGITAAVFIYKDKLNKSTVLLLATVLGGGIGNMIDRTLVGYVVDFVDFTLIDFAVFNFADICITVGAFAAFFDILINYIIKDEIKKYRKKKEEEKKLKETDIGSAEK